MNNAIINLNIDPKIKKEAMKTADEMGLTLSAAINGLLRKFITEKRLEFFYTLISFFLYFPKNKVHYRKLDFCQVLKFHQISGILRIYNSKLQK